MYNVKHLFCLNFQMQIHFDFLIEIYDFFVVWQQCFLILMLFKFSITSDLSNE